MRSYQRVPSMRRSSVRWSRVWSVAVVLAAGAPAVAGAQDRFRVVTTLPTYAAIAREITGDLAEITAIARGDEDAHFVNARPSFARLLQDADMFVSTGLDLELWVPSLLRRANNGRIQEGAPGHIVAYSGIELLDIPDNVSRAGGDVHVFGNPHVHTDPVNGIQIARNILEGLRRLDPANAAEYEARERDFESRLLRRLVGDPLVDALGEDVVLSLARGRRLWSFVDEQTYEGRPLSELVGGWMREAAPFRGRQVVCYHKNWAYFSARFEIPCAMYVEPKPGIPPSPRHVSDVISFIRDNSIPVLWAATYYSRRQVEQVAERAGATGVRVPMSVEGAPGVDTYFDLFDLQIRCLAGAFEGRETECSA
jgi:zinc/manganese transport system substrate-binding protein